MEDWIERGMAVTTSNEEYDYTTPTYLSHNMDLWTNGAGK
jgi:hypothetical protein